MCEWGISNYQPQWTNSTSELAELIAMTSLVGLQVKSLWSLWDEESDEWFSDAPVVICTQEKQLEFCATKLNEFSLSLDSIDLDLPVYWCGYKATDEQPLRWVQQRNLELRNLSGKTITDVEIVESYMTQDTQAFLGLGSWILSGIAFQFQKEYLEIVNGLDQNLLLGSRQSPEDVRYTRVTAC